LSDDEPKTFIGMDLGAGDASAVTFHEYFEHLERELLAEAGVPAALLRPAPLSTYTHLRDLLDHQERALAPMRERLEAMIRTCVPLIVAMRRGPRQPQRAGHPGGGRAARRRGEAKLRRVGYLLNRLIRACNAAYEARPRT
jgi:hypothetical protein